LSRSGRLRLLISGNRNAVQQHVREMSLEAVYPGPNFGVIRSKRPLEEGLAQLLADPLLLEKIGTGARRRYEEPLTVER